MLYQESLYYYTNFVQQTWEFKDRLSVKLKQLLGFLPEETRCSKKEALHRAWFYNKILFKWGIFQQTSAKLWDPLGEKGFNIYYAFLLYFIKKKKKKVKPQQQNLSISSLYSHIINNVTLFIIGNYKITNFIFCTSWSLHENCLVKFKNHTDETIIYN